MRKPVSVALLLTFAFAAISPAFAQRGRNVQDSLKVSSRSVFDTARAITDGNGVLIRWQMKMENSVAAYQVYRIEDGQKVLITPRLILSRSGTSGIAKYGEDYHYFDANGQAGFVYLVEGRTLSGGVFTGKALTAEAVKSVEEITGLSSETYLEAVRSNNSNIEKRTSTLDTELQSLVSLNEQEPNHENQLIVAGKQGAKIGVKKEGFYRVTAAELLSANFPTGSDSTKWRLFMNGNEQAINVGPNSQYIEFYGKGVDTASTDTRIYYLVSDTVPGKRISSKVLRQVPGAAASNRYPVVFFKKERDNYLGTLFNGDEENYLGRLLTSTPSRINLVLTGIDFSQPTATIKISLYGYQNGRHAVSPKINGFDLPVMVQFDQVFYSETFTFPTSQLVEGTNELELTTSTGSDYNLFDNVVIKYARKYEADQDKIAFTTPTSKKVDLTGFSTSNVRVFDTTYDGNPVLISNVSVVSAGNDFTAKVPSGRTMVGYAVEDSAMLQAASITENTPSTLAAATNGAEMVIIAYPGAGFLTAAETWANYRRTVAGGGFSVKVVDVTDVYDEFSYGEIGYHPIKDFLKHAFTAWSTHPKYVMLIGDGSQDARNYEGYGKFDFIPSAQVRLIKEESVSDDALVDFNDDGLVEIPIGRISARTPLEITTAFNKTVGYEASQQDLSRGLLFAHDAPLGFDFEAMTQLLIQQLPQGSQTSVVGVLEPDANATLIARMNEGKAVINYAGHGSTGIWANTTFFNQGSVLQLTNIDHPSFYVMLTCLNGYFARPDASAIGEDLLFSRTGGAAASWASTSETTPDVQLTMALRFFEKLSTHEFPRSGDLIKDAKTVVNDGTDVRLSWVLLGDPAMRMP